ncbi:8-amino-7-oxononanoate synthase [Psychroserpens sp. SPM9]|uniref:aminotransferase class I/II-fold pyridoxal phosphate-dependent enzyme n=1 Tax=Psychroserpens sp. SPM9 TaxID=2975598 RepID=UPI0021A68767|nr:8-amino-7-oxononanoate synthase [Psychroserpens sp. SPM9]MDG5490490.1 8-amino-7-oxononanoate synthase [Psychroserpens sp. SPM9]
MLPKKLQHKLDTRKQENAFRQLGQPNTLTDFASNDYLGFSQSKELFDKTHAILKNCNKAQNGATGSRLLSGNHSLFQIVEQQISAFHNSETALVFNSGYDANLGVFSCVPQRHDIVLYDEYCHASIRDGINMSNAKAFKFKHNDVTAIEQLMLRHALPNAASNQNIYVVTESVFSMDGDSPDLKTLAQLCKKYKANLIIDEAHAIGVFGDHGCGKVQELNLESAVFARIITFGKALGCHGAALLSHNDLRDYIINFSRPFIYTTALPPHSLASVKVAYDELLNQMKQNVSKLRQNITVFCSEIERLQLQSLFITSDSAIHCCTISGNDKVKTISEALKHKGFDVKAILSPTVPKGKERLRFCVHSYNSPDDITKVLELLATFVRV